MNPAVGPPLILVHGSPGDGRTWRRLAKQVSGEFRVLTPDLPGYGNAEPLSSDPENRTEAMAAAITALIDGCDAPVRLCGHSYGGNVALHAAMQRPEHVAGLVLLEPVFFQALALTGKVKVLAESVAYFASYADNVLGGDREAVRTMVDFWFGGGTFVKLPQPVRDFLLALAPKNALDVRASFAETATREQLAALAMPVTIAYGDRSPPVAPEIARALAELLPRCRLRAIQGASHGMVDSHPDAVVELIRKAVDA
ncbi:MAG TPA: alpha/beta hydrolase [Stellaceae bacterium]|nr:alpha/beta hydrolase [Stellaceae bacterium]